VLRVRPTCSDGAGGSSISWRIYLNWRVTAELVPILCLYPFTLPPAKLVRPLRHMHIASNVFHRRPSQCFPLTFKRIGDGKNRLVGTSQDSARRDQSVSVFRCPIVRDPRINERRRQVHSNSAGKASESELCAAVAASPSQWQVSWRDLRTNVTLVSAIVLSITNLKLLYGHPLRTVYFTVYPQQTTRGPGYSQAHGTPGARVECQCDLDSMKRKITVQ
jgi:hypothetical protein